MENTESVIPEPGIPKEPEEPETQKFVTIETEYEFEKVSLKSEKLECGWLTAVTVGDRTHPPIEHKEPITVYESKRDNAIAKIISIELDITTKKANKLVYDLIGAVDAQKVQQLINACNDEKTALMKQAVAKREQWCEALVKEKNERMNKVVELYNKLCNKDNQYSLDEILAAKNELREIMLPMFWSIEGANPNTGNTGHLSLKKLPIADYISKVFNMIHYGGRNWWYDWERACYQYDAEDVLIQQEVANIMKKVGDYTHKYNGNSLSDSAQIIHLASMKSVSIDNPFNKCKNVINAKNGILKLDYDNHEVEIVGKRPEYKFSYCIDTVYDPYADPASVHSMLCDIVGPDQTNMIYEIAAIAIRDADPDLDPSKVAYMFIGPKNTGKNTVMRLLTDFFGSQIVSNIPLHQLSENKFVKPLLEGKLLNVDDELPKSLPLTESRELKSLTGGKRHTLEPKNVKPYTGIITSLLVFAGNQFPRCNIPMDDSAHWDRWEIISFENQFKVQEGLINKILTPENLSGFFNKVIETLFRIHDRGITRRWGTEDRNGVKPIFNTYEEWMYSSSTVYRFIQDMTVPSEFPADYSKDSLFAYYNTWCDARGIPKEDRCITLAEFGRELLSKCKVRDVRTGSTERSYVYRMFRRYERCLAMMFDGSLGDNA